MDLKEHHISTELADAYGLHRVVSPFTSGQVKEYLLRTGFSETDINTLHRTLSFSHWMVVIQIPRYLPGISGTNV
jgi:hypothetical protein